MKDPFSEKVALITGGNSGVGLATAHQFAREGAKVALSARREAEGQEAVRQIEAAGGEAIFIQADVSSSGDVAAMVARTLDEFGRRTTPSI